MSDRRRAVFTGPFVAALALLLASAAGLRGVTHGLKLALSKQPVPLRQPLGSIPTRLGPYLQVTEYPRLSADQEGALRATAYLTRLYRDSRRPPSDPTALIRMHLAYFTGTQDTVEHVPEICYVAAGVIGRDVQHGVAELRLPAGGAGALDAGPRPLTTVPMRLFEFAAPQMTMPQTVLYFFVANGRFVGMPEQVRAQVFDLRLRRAYWCKVELLVQGAADKAQLLATAGEFLEVAVPELLTCLPDARSLGADAGEPRPVSGRSAATVSGESGGARVRHDR